MQLNRTINMKIPFSFTSSCVAAFAALTLTTLYARGAVEDTLEKSYAVTPGGSLVIDADRGSIELAPGAADRLEVTVKRVVTRGSEAKASGILARHKVEFSQDAGRVSIRSRLEGSWKNWGWNSPNLQVRYLVSLPKKFNVNLKTAGGTIKIATLEGEVKANTSGGNIAIGAVEGPATVRTSGGSIEIESATGSVMARTSGGNIKLGVMKSDVDAETSGGSINLKQSLARTRLGTSGGNITVEQADGELDAGTSGGSVRVGLTGSPSADCSLRTSGGNIRISLPENAAADIDASTSGGSVKSELPVTVQGVIKRGSLVGKLGAGGRLIKARTSGGSISLEKASW